MSHLEMLVAEYLEWQGYLIKRNTKVGKRVKGGWEMELDIVGYHPKTQDLIHYEPSLDAYPWPKREKRYQKKFEACRKYVFKDIFPWLPHSTVLRQIAVFPSHGANKRTIAGGDIVSIDELVSEIREKVMACGVVSRNAIPELYPLLRTMQLSHMGYYKKPR